MCFTSLKLTEKLKKKIDTYFKKTTPEELSETSKKYGIGRLRNPEEIEDYEYKAKVLYANGWTDLWHKDNWIKKEWIGDHSIDVDRAGCSTDVAYSTFNKDPY